MIRPDGTVKHYDKKSVVDLIADPDDVYDEGRLKIINASDDVDVGYIFGYSVVSEDTPLFFQDQWTFQDNLPTLVSRYSLSLPSGWQASSITFNGPEIKPQLNEGSYVWELHDLPAIRNEPLRPSVANLVPRIVINYSPGTNGNTANRVFTAGQTCQRWATALYDPQVVVDDNIAAKARN